MPSSATGKDEQRSGELEDLRTRLAEAEATLRALRDGDLDALVVSDAGGDKLLAIEGASQPYRLLIENMSEGALTLTPDGLVLYANRRFAEMLRSPLEKVIGSEIHVWFAPESRQVLQALLRKDATGNRREELALAAADGTRVPVYLSVNRLLLDEMPDSLCIVATDLTEQKRNEAILASERLARAILEQAADAIVICDETGRIIRASKQAQAFYDKNLLGQLFEHAFPLRQLDGTSFSAVGAIDSSLHQSVEAGLEHNGKRFDLLVSVGHLVGARNELLGSVVTLTNITGRKQEEKKLNSLNRVLAVLSGINALIVRVHDRRELFNEACRIAVEHGHFAMAWIGALDPATQDVIPVAWTGNGAEAMTRARSSARDDSPRGKGAVGRAIRERRPVHNNDIVAHNFGGPRAKEIQSMGFGSQITLPLYEGPAVAATLTMYARERNFFDEEELRLLTELAGNISFAIENISKQQKFDKLSRIRAISSAINAAIVRTRERDALLKEACRIASGQGKFEMVWIATIDPVKQEIRPVAWTGFSEGTARAVNWASVSTSKGTLGEVIQTRKPSVRADIETEMPGGKLRQEALQQGCRSSVCLPLVVDDTVVALIFLCAPGVGFFDEEELALLSEVASDISFALQAIEKAEKLDYLAYYDVLTGFANRTLFLERVAQYMRSAVSGRHKLAVGLIDLERFKNINDSLGQPAGDALLKQVAGWLTRNLGDANLVARLDADHFAVVLPEVKQDGDVARLIEKLMEAFQEHPFRLNDAVFRIAAKVGVALYPEDGADAQTLFRNAEAALKKAKAGGERYLFYAQKMTAAVAGKLTLENQLRQALDNEEFVLHYQPKVNLTSGKMTSAEALIRWNDPRTGLVPPGNFIPILEETGLIVEVGRWALKKALSDYLRWRAAGLPAARIAVNVSPLQLRNRGFIDEIKQVISIDPHAAAGLELEITESLIMEDVKHSITILQAIRILGVTIAIDDFGTGFSSLSYLAKLPVHTLKIDRSFVIDMTAGPQGLALVSTIINLAHSLNLKVVAEGVETDEQSNLLRLLKCNEMQGYLYSKPVPVDVFEARFLAAPPAGTTKQVELPATTGGIGQPRALDILR